MPAKGCPLPNIQQPEKCKDCPLNEVERIEKCRWYSGILHGLKPDRLRTVSNGVLLLSFSMIELSQANLTKNQTIIVYVSMVISVALAICALLPFDLDWLSNGWIYGTVSLFTLVVWFFTFLIEWIHGITNTKNFASWSISILGVLWLFVALMLLTRGFSLVAQRNKSIKWLPYVIPLMFLWRTTIVYFQGDLTADIVMTVFLVGSTTIALGIWKPAGEFSV